MQWYGPLGRAGLAWWSLAPLCAQPALWEAPFVVALARVALLLLLAAFAVPGLGAASQPLVAWLGGESALHYPDFYLRLPSMLNRAELALALSLAVLAHGAATLRFASGFARQREERAWRHALRRSPALLLFAVLAWAIEAGGERILLLLAERLPSAAMQLGRLAAQVVARALLCYAIAAALLRERGIWASLRSAFEVIRDSPITTALLVGVPTLAIALIGARLGAWSPIASGLWPEAMLPALALWIGLQMLTAFVLIGSTTRFYLARTESRR